jgi:sialic acid synthase SpsE
MRTKLIADLTSNHIGNKEVIESMIHALSENGVEVVKTQSWQVKKLRKDIPDYEINVNYYKKHEFSDEDHHWLKDTCKKYGVEFLTTCFDLDRIEDLAAFGLKRIKIASPDANSYKMIKRALDKFEEIIISTGATTDDELNKIMDICQGKNVVMLHCMTIYPCPLDQVNMDRMLYIRDKGFRFGYSDHTLGTEAGKYAICLGAEFLEKHFTLNRFLPGRDQKMSSTIEDFVELSKWAESVEKMKGTASRLLTDTELDFRRNYYGKWGNNT